MIGRLFIILVALQFVVTSAFAHVMPMSEPCAEPVAQHMHGEAFSELQERADDGAFGADRQPEPMGLLHCAGIACTDQFGGASISDLPKNFRRADLTPAEPCMALQTVLLSYLRPPLA
ncbi:hypothetical protein AL037_12125 [Salipiger aestuarii]|nr:hypothetical protein AL037_12125 [Salipiger aestuarii]